MRRSARAAWAAGLLVCVAAAVAAGGCKDDGPAALFEESQRHLAEAATILETHAGDDDAALAALDAYLAEHGAEIDRLRREGARALGELSAEERRAFMAETRPETERLVSRVMNALRTFDNPPVVMQKMQAFR